MRKFNFLLHGTILFVVTLALLVSPATEGLGKTVFALNSEASIIEQSSTSKNTSLYDNATIAATNYVGMIQTHTSQLYNSKLFFEFPLFDFDNKITSFLFSIRHENGDDNGYLIVSADDKSVVLESTRSGSHPYGKLSDNEQGIYVGATMYYIKDNLSNQYYDIRQGKFIPHSDLKSKGTLKGKEADVFFLKNINKTEEILPLASKPNTIINYSYKLIKDVPDFSWHMGCSPTAFSNIVKYWADNGYSNLVSRNTSTNTLIETMASYMNTNQDGTTDWDDRVNGMVNYWEDKNYSVKVSRVNPSFSTHKTEMNNDRPNIINVVHDATYGDHDMTGVGYEEYQVVEDNFNMYRYVIVHDTWDTTIRDVYLYLPNLSWYETVKVTPK